MSTSDLTHFYYKLEEYNNKTFIPLVYNRGEILSSKENREEFVILAYEQQISENLTNETIIFFLGKLKEIEKYKKVYFDGLEKLPEIESISVSLHNLKEKYELINKQYGAISFGLWPIKWKK